MMNDLMEKDPIGNDSSDDMDCYTRFSIKQEPEMIVNEIWDRHDKDSTPSSPIMLIQENANEHEPLEQKLKNIEKNQLIITKNQVKMQKKILDLQEETRANHHKIITMLNHLAGVQLPDKQYQFPISSIEEIETINNDASKNMEAYTAKIKKLIMPEGLYANFGRLFSREIILRFNYDGVCNKNSFKMYTSINNAIFEAIKKEGYVEKDYIKDIRHCFKNYKCKYFKRLSNQRKRQK